MVDIRIFYLRFTYSNRAYSLSWRLPPFLICCDRFVCRLVSSPMNATGRDCHVVRFYFPTFFLIELFTDRLCFHTRFACRDWTPTASPSFSFYPAHGSLASSDVVWSSVGSPLDVRQVISASPCFHMSSPEGPKIFRAWWVHMILFATSPVVVRMGFFFM